MNPILVLLVPVAVVLLAAAYWVLRALAAPCEACNRAFCSCTGGEIPSLPLLAADTQADFVATRLAHLDESVEEWAARTGNQPTPSTRRAVTRVDLPAPRRET